MDHGIPLDLTLSFPCSVLVKLESRPQYTAEGDPAAPTQQKLGLLNNNNVSSNTSLSMLRVRTITDASLVFDGSMVDVRQCHIVHHS